MTFRLAIFVATAGALLLAAAAAGHVSIKPERVPADSLARLTLSAPTEGDSPMTSLKVQVPPAVTVVSFPPKPGWKRTITTKRLAKPITVDGKTITERIATVEWSGGMIGVGETGTFSFRAHVPNRPGAKLPFPAIQTYANGEIARWIGAPDAEHPGPFVTLGAAERRPPPPPPVTTPTAEPPPLTTTSATDDDDNDAFVLGLASAGLAVGLIALGLVLMRRRRR